MGTAITKIEPVPLPDPRKRMVMQSLPGWVASRVDALAENPQIVGETFQNVLTLPTALMPTEAQRTEMRRHIEGLTSLLRLTPETSENAEKATVVIVTKLLLVLAGQRASEDAAEAKGEA